MLPSKKLLLPFCLFSAVLAFAAILPTHAESFRNPRRIPLPVDPTGVTTGDLNGDGRNDIVWTERPAYPDPAVLHVLLADPTGQYTPAPNLVLPFFATFMQCIIEDVTGDKRNDLICVGASINYTDVFLVTYTGNGDGTFAPPVQTKVAAQPLFSNPIIAGAGDLNGDGLSDVIVINAFYSGILPYFSDGKGGFKPGTQFQGSFNYSVPTVTDLNGDGKLDVLWPTGPRVDLGNGDGTFGAIVQYDPGYLSNCAFGDVDGDGHLDAACTWYDGGDIDGHIHLTVLHGNSDGSFDKTPIFTRTFGSGENQYDGIPTILSPVLVADLNGDGYADIVSLSGDGYCVLLGGPNTTWNGQPQQFVSASWQSQGGLFGIYGVSLADMNGDGLPDIVAIGPNGLYITYAQRDGTLSSAPAVEVGEISTSASLVDVNGDGNLDVVSAGDTALKLSLGHGDGTFGPPQPITSSGNFGDALYAQGRVLSGDFNGDGKQDLLATGNVAVYTTQNYILFGHGDGTFDAPLPIANNFPFGKVADLNSDGRSDIISIQNNSTGTNNELVVSLSRGDGTFTNASTSLPVETMSNSFIYSSSGPALADFRHTGRLDSAVASFNNAYMLRSHGDGTFDSSGTALAIPDLPNLNKIQAYDVAAGDFDGDGNPDIAVLLEYGNGAYNLSTPTSAVWVFYGNGDGTFSSATLAGTFNRDAQTLTAGDLNGDGLADLVLTSYEVYQYNGVLIVHALPNRTWGAEVDYTGGEGLSRLWITDINHDGRNDLVFSNAGRANYASNSISVLLNEGNTPTVQGTLVASPEPSVSGQSFALTATLTPPPGIATPNLSGTVSFFIDGVASGSAQLVNNIATVSVTSTPSIGTHQLTATWPGQASGAITLAPVALSGTHVVTGRPVTLSIAANPMSPNVGQSVAFTVSIADSGAGPSVPPTGIIQILNGSSQIASFTVIGNGTFTFNYAPTAAGNDTFSAVYSGDAAHSSATANVVLDVQLLQPAMTVTSFPNPSIYGQPITFMVTVSGGTSGLIPSGVVLMTGPFGSQIRINLDASGKGTYVSPPPGNSYAIPEPAGTLPLIPTYLGDTNFAPITGTTYIQTILPAPSAITLTASPTQVYQLQTVNLTATVTGLVSPTINPITGVLVPPVNFYATGTVQFFDGAIPIGSNTLTNGQATLPVATLSVGTHSLTAQFVANSNLGGSTSSVVTVVVLPSDFSIAIDPKALSLQTGHHTNLSLTLASIGAFSDDITFQIGSLPQYATVNVTPAQIHLNAAGQVNASIYLDTDALVGFISQRSAPDSVAQPQSRMTLALLLSPLALLLFRRKRRIPRIVAVFTGLALLLGASGCGDNKYPASTAPGSYTIHITALGLQSGVSHSADLALAVTP